MKQLSTIPQGELTISLEKCSIHFNSKSTDTKVHDHYELVDRINIYLTRRGFKVTADPKVVKSISSSYRIGKKGNLEFYGEKYPAGFRYEFFQNINIENRNGGRYDFDKFGKMPYLIKKSWLNEAYRLKSFLESIGVSAVIEKPKTDEERCVERNNTNLHIHGEKISKLSDLIGVCERRPISTYNSKDRDKKEIKCGDLKYHYGYGKSLKRGIVYHNINNMWHVLDSTGKIHNISAFRLFDYNGEPKKIKLDAAEQIQRIHQELKKAEDAQNYVRCIKLKKLIGDEKLFNIWSERNNAWWGPNNSGYTSEKRRAGVYPEFLINANKSYYNNGDSARPVPQ